MIFLLDNKVLLDVLYNPFSNRRCVSFLSQISTGPFEGMQSIGVRLLSIIMDKVIHFEEKRNF